jgi:hypothetical protein
MSSGSVRREEELTGMDRRGRIREINLFLSFILLILSIPVCPLLKLTHYRRMRDEG